MATNGELPSGESDPYVAALLRAGSFTRFARSG